MAASAARKQRVLWSGQVHAVDYEVTSRESLRSKSSTRLPGDSVDRMKAVGIVDSREPRSR